MLENKLNFLLLCNVLILLTMAGVMAGRLYQWSSTHGPRMKYVYPEQDFDWSKAAGISFASYFVLFNGIIPLAMIITLEFAKITCSHLMGQDVDMMNFETAKNFYNSYFYKMNNRRPECRT